MRNMRLKVQTLISFCVLMGVALLSFCELCAAPKKQPTRQVLWYTRPASNWMKEALPIGNGRIGAMIFGGLPVERVQFNDKTLWTGSTTVRGAYQNFGNIFIDFGALVRSLFTTSRPGAIGSNPGAMMQHKKQKGEPKFPRDQLILCCNV